MDLLVIPYGQPGKDDIRIVTMLEDIAHDRTPWTADILVGSSDTDYNGKFGWSQDSHGTNPLPEVVRHSYLDNR